MNHTMINGAVQAPDAVPPQPTDPAPGSPPPTDPASEEKPATKRARKAAPAETDPEPEQHPSLGQKDPAWIAWRDRQQAK
jgi:hypothetical protein